MTKRIAKLTCPASGLVWQCVADDLATPNLAYHPGFATLGMSRANLAHTKSAAAASAVLHHLRYTISATTHKSKVELTDAQIKFLTELQPHKKGGIKYDPSVCPITFINTLMGKTPGHVVSRTTTSMKDVAARVSGKIDAVADAKRAIVKEGNTKLIAILPLLDSYTGLSVEVQNKVRHALYLNGYDAAAKELERRRIIMSKSADLFSQLDDIDLGGGL